MPTLEVLVTMALDTFTIRITRHYCAKTLPGHTVNTIKLGCQDRQAILTSIQLKNVSELFVRKSESIVKHLTEDLHRKYIYTKIAREMSKEKPVKTTATRWLVGSLYARDCVGMTRR